MAKKLTEKEVIEIIDKRVDEIYKAGYNDGFRRGAESQRVVFEQLIKFNRGDRSMTELKEAEKKLISQQKREK